MLATESFFKAGEVLSRKERKERKEMKDGNEANAASGITQFAEGEPKRRNYDTVSVYQPLKGGNGVSETSEVTLCSKCTCRIALAKNASGSRTKTAKETSRKVRKVREVNNR